MPTSRRNRVLWPDIVRSLAIYLVVVIHSTAPLAPTVFLWPFQLILNILSMSAVPLFVMLSGALLLKVQEPTHVFFTKRLSRLLTPWFFWTVCTCAFLLGTKGLPSPLGLMRLAGSTLQSFWFLPMIVGLYLITPALRVFIHAAKKQDVAWLMLLWFLGTSLFPYVHDSLAFPRSVDNGLVRQVITYSGYFLIGWLVTQLRVTKKTLPLALLLIALGISWSTIATLRTPLSPAHTFSQLQYGYISPGVVLSSIGIFITVWSIGNRYEKTISTPLRTTLHTVSNATLGIYLSHLLIRDLLLSGGISLTVLPMTWLGANYLNGAVLFGISVGVVVLLQRIALLRRYIS